MAIIYDSEKYKIKVLGRKNIAEITSNNCLMFIIKEKSKIQIIYMPSADVKYHFVIDKNKGYRNCHIDYSNNKEGKAKYALIRESVPKLEDIIKLSESLVNIGAIVRKDPKNPLKYSIPPLVDELEEKMKKVISFVNTRLKSMEQGYNNLSKSVFEFLFLY